MAAPGGADQPELAEQIQLLREQNNLLVQQNLQLQQGRPAARVQPQPERRRFLEPPTEADLDEQRLYLIPATLTRGPNSHRLPRSASRAGTSASEKTRGVVPPAVTVTGWGYSRFRGRPRPQKPP
ncbi:hypothetical protein NFJ02_22g50440 [Pycnococcus provasolii]